MATIDRSKIRLGLLNRKHDKNTERIIREAMFLQLLSPTLISLIHCSYLSRKSFELTNNTTKKNPTQAQAAYFIVTAPSREAVG